MSNKLQRIITAFILGPIILIAIAKSSLFAFLIVSIAITLIASFEFFNMLNASRSKFLFLPAFISSFIIPFGFYKSFEYLIISIVLIMMLTVILQLFSKEPLENTFNSISNTLLASFYVPMLFSFLILLKIANWQYIFLLLFIIWSSDSAAYFFGIKYGKNRLYEKISPKKSIEGLIAGIIAGILFSVIYCKFFLYISFIDAVLIGLIVSVFGVAGDLAESMFKRTSGIKDSSQIIPGHGGMLDRIDSLLFGAPVLYFYMKFFI